MQPPPEDQDLDASGSAVFGSNGIAVVELRPNRLKQWWTVTSATVSTAGPAPDSKADNSTAVLYRNGWTQLDGTYTGSLDSTDLNLTIRRGFLRARWTGGIPGYTATLSLYGTIHFG